MEENHGCRYYFSHSRYRYLISVLSIVLKQAKKEEQAEMLTLAGVVVVLIIVVQLMNQLFTVVRSVLISVRGQEHIYCHPE